MRVLLVDAVVGRVVEAKNDISLNTMHIGDEQVGKTRAVGDEVCANALGFDLVFTVWLNGATVAHNSLTRSRLRQSGQGQENRQSGNRASKHGEHD